MSNINAIILAAGTSSRFTPLSEEFPKALLSVKGEILIERQIRQLKVAGINDITVVVGYKAYLFEYLREKYNVKLVFNEDYARYNNVSSLIRVLDCLKNTFICSADNYFPSNIFLDKPRSSYYSALFSTEKSNEYFLTTNEKEEITDVRIGGAKGWYMIGHVFFSEEFSSAFREVMEKEYDNEETRKGYWEDLYVKHLSELPPLRINRYKEGEIREFDSLDELRQFDTSYIDNTRSSILHKLAIQLKLPESCFSNFKKLSNQDEPLRFSFLINNKDHAVYDDNVKSITVL